MQSEAKHISHSVTFLCLLLGVLSFLDFVQPIFLQPDMPELFSQLAQFGVIWPYFSLLFALFLLLLGARFPARSKMLRSAYRLSLISFLLVFESFGLFQGHPLFSFVPLWNYSIQLFLPHIQSLAPGDFLPLVIFTFWGNALMMLILPAERFPLLHWVVCFHLFFFSGLHIAAAAFFQFYHAGLGLSLLALPLLCYHMAQLLQQRTRLESLAFISIALFYILLLTLLILNTGPQNIATSSISLPSLQSNLASFMRPVPLDLLEIKFLRYTMFFLWFSFLPLLLFSGSKR